MARYQNQDRNSKFYNMQSLGTGLHVDLHPNKTSGGYFRIANVEEGEALVQRLMEGVDALRAETRKRENADVPLPADAEGEV